MTRTVLILIFALLLATGATGEWLAWWESGLYTIVASANEGDGWGVRFDPPFECGWIETVEFYVCKDPDGNWDGFDVWICEYRPGAGIPGVFLHFIGTITYDLPGDEGWVSVPEIHYFWGTMDSFVIALIQINDSPNCDSLAVDSAQTSPNPNFNYYDGYWTPFILKNGDFLIQVEYLDYEAITPNSIGYIKSLYR
jgi:hypothetical protein